MQCVLCNGPTVSTVVREEVPALQNRVFASAEEARAARRGRLDIHACQVCGYVFNREFDAGLVAYDTSYNNDVPSKVFDDYYAAIASYLHTKYLSQGGTVLDIGCGKGKFLQVMTTLFGDVNGVGIDPSCNRGESERLTLVSGTFPECQAGARADLVVCRHTLEHISDPAPFVRAIAGALPAGTPVFVEVPDTKWIVRQRAFWDFCHEHVNYFVSESATVALSQAGIGDIRCSVAFGGQYLWVEGVVGAGNHKQANSQFAEEMSQYAASEQVYTSAVRSRLVTLKQEGNVIVVWGMATKGIEFVGLIDPGGAIIDYCVDINKAKQGQYTPCTARVIQSPEVLRKVRSRMVIVVMNPRYLDEIRADCARMSLDAECITF